MSSLTSIDSTRFNLSGSSVHVTGSQRKRLLEDESNRVQSTYEDRKSNNPELPNNINFEELRKGKIQYEDLAGYEDDGVKVLSHHRESESKLKALKTLRYGASGLSVITSIMSSVYLLFSGFKKLTSSIGLGDVESANAHTGRAFNLGAVAGVANAAAQENFNWGLGSLGMGLLGKHLDKPWGLALFSIFDGLNAIGMGEVNRRDKKNGNAFKNSIFNNKTFDKPYLKFLRKLMPYENSVKSFWKRVTTVQGWKKLFDDEPYSLFDSAGGGLISGGVILGALSAFSGKMSDRAKSLLYLPYSFTSMFNLIALGRDGAKVKERAHLMNGRKPIETKLMDVEGLSKMVAAPVVGLNYALLGLKGFGIDVKGATEGLSMWLRSWGVASAYLGFAAQSASNLVVTDKTGPLTKEIFNIVLNPKLVMKKILNLVTEITSDKKIQSEPASDFCMDVISNDKFSELLLAVLNTKRMRDLIPRPLTGYPSMLSPDRYLTSRGVHSYEASANGCIFFDRTRLNNPDVALLKDDDYEAAFKLAATLHDNGHADLPRCHHVEGAVPGTDNDHQSLYGLSENTEIYNTIVNWYTTNYGPEGAEKAKKVIKLAKDMIGLHLDEYKPADVLAYSKALGSDYNMSFGTDAWSKSDFEFLADQRIAYTDKVKVDGVEKEVVKIGWTEQGAVMLFDQLYDRLVFNLALNSHPYIAASEHAAKIGIQNAHLTNTQVFKMSISEFDEAAKNGVNKVQGVNSESIRIPFGGEKAYCSYGEKWKIWVVEKDISGQVVYKEDFLKHYETVIKQNDLELYESLKHKVKALTTPGLIELNIKIDPNFDNTAALKARALTQVARPEPVSQPSQAQRSSAPAKVNA